MAAEQGLDDSYAAAAFIVEKETGVTLTPEYPAFKFLAQLEEIEKYYKKQNDEYNKSKSSKTLGGKTLG